MKKYLVLVLTAFMVIALSGTVWAADTATQTVTYEVTAINEISVSASTLSLKVNTATAGSEPTAVTDATTTYAITTNGTGIKITGKIDTAMPTGVTLEVLLEDPDAEGGATSTEGTLSATAVDLVTGIATLAVSGKTITYTLSATVAVGVVESADKIVTFTLTDGSV
ncbi:MAG TPA: hypothetical protein PLJ97_03195 [Candidatus Saccharibacteria bacterium]|nr:hypothetical protein [Candidatus Saccharibacteria bacterium]